jgi:hypothetical protein
MMVSERHEQEEAPLYVCKGEVKPKSSGCLAYFFLPQR